MLPLLAIVAIAAGLLLVIGDQNIGRRARPNPESGAAMSRMLGLILLVGGGLMFLSWTR
ncbi:MAG TPA: hypothetical protein VFJ82_10565 [Longimicrobium sp.]|nr:hypothetical protein [Longimicrobium sp.]